LKICYVDDEKDTVLITSDEEFSYATELVQPLKLVVTKASTPPTTPCVVDVTVEPTSPCRRGRGGHCGEFKARCESKKQWREEKLTLSKEERIARKTTRISERIKHLEALPLSELPPHRQRCVTWKLENLRLKLDTLQLLSGCASQTPQPQNSPTIATSEPEIFDRRGCRGRGGRGGCRGRSEKTFENHEPSQCEKRGPKFDNPIWQCRQDLRAARDSGDQIEIERCEKAFEEARMAKWAAKREGKPNFSERSRKCECMKNLREARASGDAQKIKECVDALIEAKEALQKAKVVRKC
jgi:hypothetical protein